MIITVKIIIRKTITNASFMLCSPKNTGDHIKFKASWTMKMLRGMTFSRFNPSFKNKNNEMVIKIYKIGHTIEKMYDGGDKYGLFKYWYQEYI